MLKVLIAQLIGQAITDEEFVIIMEIATDDIKFNRISFKKYTNLAYVLDIAAKSAEIFKRCA